MTFPISIDFQQADHTFVKQLAQQCDGQPLPSYLAFWKPTPKVVGRIDQSCLSQWFPSLFEMEGQTYACAEQAMMAEKARLFNDSLRYEQILETTDPGKIRALGRQIVGFNDKVWQQHRFDIVSRISYHKFSQDAHLENYLRQTSERVLIEASPLDSIWGIRLAVGAPQVPYPDQWQGLNLLGFALMQARARL